ncbi:hypothetical protein G8C93_06170 [Cellulosimicrobium cellulans]|uniref:hypothetical protein n=1 Tax=Cellulosimicrobium cellulans TaxID=1710 RepID=UPI001883CDB0|nr:hypothetical protein [Cellulosimicrobium cellulans]MBE9925475.1 hypothetical protein [Cellulosimicrobium cellulans]
MRILWRDVARFFDESVEGRLPDGYVRGSRAPDGARLVERYQVLGWPVERDGRPWDGGAPRRAADHELPAVLVRPDPGVSVNLFLWPDDDIAFDVDAREIHDQRTLDAVCRFLAQTGRALATDVDLCPEGTTTPFVRYTRQADSVGRCP